jgi:hypothetical protein
MPYSTNHSAIAVERNGDDIVIFIPGYFEMTIDEEAAIGLAKAIYAKAIRMPLAEAEAFFGESFWPRPH